MARAASRVAASSAAVGDRSRSSPPAAAAPRRGTRDRATGSVGHVIAAGADPHAPLDRLAGHLHAEPRRRRGRTPPESTACGAAWSRRRRRCAAPRRAWARTSCRAAPWSRARRGSAGHAPLRRVATLRGGGLEVAVAHQGVPVLDARRAHPPDRRRAPRRPGRRCACSITLAGCTHAWPHTGMPARWAASVSRRTDTESSWA